MAFKVKAKLFNYRNFMPETEGGITDDQMKEATHLNPDEQLARVRIDFRGVPMIVKERYEGQFSRDPVTGIVTEACRREIERAWQEGRGGF